MADDEVGSLGQETLKLLRALADQSSHGSTAPREEHGADGVDAQEPGPTGHVCTTGWCPVCQVVGFVKENPDVVDEVAAAALHLARTVKDAVEVALRPPHDGTTGGSADGSTVPGHEGVGR